MPHNGAARQLNIEVSFLCTVYVLWEDGLDSMLHHHARQFNNGTSMPLCWPLLTDLLAFNHSTISAVCLGLGLQPISLTEGGVFTCRTTVSVVATTLVRSAQLTDAHVQHLRWHPGIIRLHMGHCHFCSLPARLRWQGRCICPLNGP